MTDFQKVMTAIKKSTDFRIVDKYGDDYDITLNDGMEDIICEIRDERPEYKVVFPMGCTEHTINMDKLAQLQEFVETLLEKRSL